MDIDEFEDFELEENKIEYQIWLLGYQADNTATNFDYFIDSFDSSTEALKCAEFFSNLENIKLLKNTNCLFAIPEEVKFISVIVEEVVEENNLEECFDILYEERIEVK